MLLLCMDSETSMNREPISSNNISRISYCQYLSYCLAVAIEFGGTRICSKVRTSLSKLGRRKAFSRRKI